MISSDPQLDSETRRGEVSWTTRQLGLVMSINHPPVIDHLPGGPTETWIITESGEV